MISKLAMSQGYMCGRRQRHEQKAGKKEIQKGSLISPATPTNKLPICDPPPSATSLTHVQMYFWKTNKRFSTENSNNHSSNSFRTRLTKPTRHVPPLLYNPFIVHPWCWTSSWLVTKSYPHCLKNSPKLSQAPIVPTPSNCSNAYPHNMKFRLLLLMDVSKLYLITSQE